MKTRKGSKAVRRVHLRTGEPLSYGSNLKLPRPQERVPRSIPRPLMTARKAGMTRAQILATAGMNRMSAVAEQLRLENADRLRRLKLRQGMAKHDLAVYRRIVAERSVSKWRRRPAPFRFKSPFYRQYQQIKFAGKVVRNPKKVAFCVARKVRREVLFAFRRAGYRGSGPGRRRTYRRNGNSLHGC